LRGVAAAHDRLVSLGRAARLYVVWFPLYPGQDPALAVRSAAELCDENTVHYRDAAQRLSAMIADAISAPAQDLSHAIVSYDAGVNWSSPAPRPSSWH
jgi:hypothetical protein